VWPAALLDDGNRATSARFVKAQLAMAGRGEQPREVIGRNEDRDEQSHGTAAERRPTR
jgi:hypothetical protein